MRLDLSETVYAIRSSFWFIPSVLAASAIAGAFGISELDFTLHRYGSGFYTRLAMPIESARLALSTIAGSMITVASLVFSMTLVALTMVAQQLGPRILMRFMDDRPTQLVLGLFIATFLFCLVILLQLDEESTNGRVPSLAILISSGLAVLSLAMMIHFIHHIANRIQADVLIAELGHDLCEAVARFAERGSSKDSYAAEGELERLNEILKRSPVAEISLGESGYLRRLHEKSAQTAASQNVVLKLHRRPGDFLLAGARVVTVHASAPGTDRGEKEDDTISALLTVGRRRTPEASVEFEMKALVEVALRALSPVNAGENVGQRTGVKVDHLRRRCSKQEGPARGAFLLSRVVREVMRSGALWTA